jgi:hypothetical protein
MYEFLHSQGHYVISCHPDVSGSPQEGMMQRLQVDDKLELGRKLNGKIGGVRAPDDLVDVIGCATIRISNARAVTNHSSLIDVFS